MYQRIAPIALAVLVAGSAVAGCGSSTPQPTRDTTKPPTSAAPAATTSSHGVKLSTKWVPKLNALSNGDGVAACQDSGSTDCLTAMTADLKAFTSILKDIDAQGAQAEYTKTVAEINKMTRAADAYDKDGCGGDPNADVDGSPCPGNALAVTVGVATLSFILPTDELNAGVS